MIPEAEIVPPRSRRFDVATLVLAVLGLAGALASLAYLSARVFNVVTYQLEPLPEIPGLRSSARFWLLPAIALVGTFAGVYRSGFARRDLHDRPPRPWAMLGPAVAGTVWVSGAAETLRANLAAAGDIGASLATMVNWALLVLFVGGLACTACTDCGRTSASTRRSFWPAGLVLLAAILAISAWHAAEQGRFWRNFSMGYADFGLFTTELEHCLPGKDVGPARFSDTRLGYHFIPLFYGLAPLYAAWRSPYFLMFVGPLALHLAALPFAWLAYRRTASPVAALLAGIGWLALPSLSRLPYSNTYGFQSIYLAATPLAVAISAGIVGKWRWAAVAIGIALLAEETVAGMVFGAGLYLMSTGRRRAGGAVAGIAIAYVLVAAGLVIPTFASAARYTRLDLFGDVDGPGVLARLLRPRVWMYVAALAVPLWPGLRRRLGMLVIVAPTLLLVLLLQPDYLNIKYWHQTTILVALYAAAVAGATAPKAPGAPASGASHLGGMVLAALVLHAVMGYSPCAQAGRLAVVPAAPPADDPRVQAVLWVRTHVDPARYEVIATERLAAHFTAYRSVHALAAGGLAATADRPAVLVLDAGDGWDRLVRAKALAPALAEAAAKGFVEEQSWAEGRVRVYRRAGSDEGG